MARRLVPRSVPFYYRAFSASGGTVAGRLAPRSVPRSCRAFSASGGSSSSSGGTGEPGLPAHLAYRPESAADMATLLLMAKSAVSVDYDDGSFWRACSLRAQRLLAEPGTLLADGVKFAEAAATVRYRDDELMYNLGDAVVQGLKQKSGPAFVNSDILAAMLKTHAILGFDNKRVLGQLEKHVMLQMQESKATAGGLATAVWSLAKLHDAGIVPQPNGELLVAVSRMVSEHMNLFDASQLTATLEAFGWLKFAEEPQRTALARISSNLARRIKDVSASDCGTMSWALAKARVQDDRLLVAIGTRLRQKEFRDSLQPQAVVQLLYGLAKFGCQDTALLDLLSIEARRQLHLLSLSETGAVLASVAKAGISSQVLTGRVVARIKRTPMEEMGELTMRELLNLAMALGKLQVKDRKLFKTLGDACLRHGGASLSNLSIAECVNLVHAFAKVHHVHAELFRELSQIIGQQYDELSQHDVVKYTHAVAKLEYSVPPRLQDQIMKTLQDKDLAKLGVFELMKVAAAAKRLAIHAPELEGTLAAVLPNENRGRDTFHSAGKRASPDTKRRLTARKRKWTW